MLHRKVAASLLLLGAIVTVCAHAQNIVGQWQGTLKSRNPLPTVLVISTDRAGRLDAYMVSIKQTPEHIPITSISFAHGELHFSIATVHGTYRGKMSNDGNRIIGTWTQGTPTPLNFQRATRETSWLPKSKIRMISVAPGVSLEVIDWGGNGPPLVFLAGLGNTAHIFDDFAPKFVPEYHVYGITRRGFGASTSPVPSGSNYSANQLGDDVLKVIDTLGLKKPVLIGHSIAGEELSSIGSRYPNRIAGLIYLDAGYGYALYSPDSGNSRLDAEVLQRTLNEYLSGSATDQERTAGKLLKDLPRLQKDLESDQKQEELLPPPPQPGKGTQPPFASASAAIIKSEQIFTNIPVPTLAIFADPHDTARLPHLTANQKAEWVALDKRKTTAQANAFEKLKSAKVVIIPNADHYLFISNEREVEKDVKDFLESLNLNGN